MGSNASSLSSNLFFCYDCKGLSSDMNLCWGKYHRNFLQIPKEITKKYNLGNCVGSGSFGFVLRGWNSKKEPCALKFFCIRGTTPIAIQEEYKDLENEINIMKNIKCEYIIKYYESYRFETEKCAVIVMELAEKNLREMINSLSTKEALNMLSQMCEALDYLHSVHQPNIIHRDLKPENILLISNKVKICDFGVSKAKHNEKTNLTSIAGTDDYMAPEIVDKEDTIDCKVDIWALGIIVHMMFSKGVHPFGDEWERGTNMKKMKYTISTEIKNSKIKKIIERCLVKMPEQRASIKEIIEILFHKKELKIYQLSQITQNISDGVTSLSLIQSEITKEEYLKKNLLNIII